MRRFCKERLGVGERCWRVHFPLPYSPFKLFTYVFSALLRVPNSIQYHCAAWSLALFELPIILRRFSLSLETQVPSYHLSKGEIRDLTMIALVSGARRLTSTPSYSVAAYHVWCHAACLSYLIWCPLRCAECISSSQPVQGWSSSFELLRPNVMK